MTDTYHHKFGWIQPQELVQWYGVAFYGSVQGGKNGAFYF